MFKSTEPQTDLFRLNCGHLGSKELSDAGIKITHNGASGLVVEGCVHCEAGAKGPMPVFKRARRGDEPEGMTRCNSCHTLHRHEDFGGHFDACPARQRMGFIEAVIVSPS